MTRPWVANRPLREAVAWEPDGETVCVSITDPGDEARLPEFLAVHRECFEDWDSEPMESGVVRKYPDTAVLMMGGQAKRIADFVTEHRGRNILVHCHAGVSRSAGVVEAILAAFPEYEDRGYPRHPNGRVKSLMTRALGVVPIGAA